MRRGSIIAVAAAIGAGLALSRPAEACGGFFCNNVPVSQSGEHIVFTVTDDAQWGTVTEAHVQIQYTGDAKKFAWVVPVHAKPTLDVGTTAFFTRLDTSTAPQFQLTFGQQCHVAYPEEAAGGAVDAGTVADGGANGGGVTVVSQEDVGPYDAATLQATDDTALKEWLQTNGYQITDEGAAALKPYVGPNYYFVALKLQSDKSVGDLRPIVLTMNGTTPCIPIQLTAIAAQPDMPITAYFFAKGRAVPTNYEHVIINEARIDWLNGGYNYSQVATAAIDEAGGHAFLTEFAGPVSSTTLSMSKLDAGLDTARLAMLTDPVAFVQELIIQNFPRDGLLALLEKYIPEPKALVDQGVPEQQFYNRISFYKNDIDNDPGRAPFDAQGFAKELQDSIVTPLQHAQHIVDNFPYMTRLYTTMSPQEMTLDPEFAFNTGLGDVSNIHKATASCDGNSSFNSPITITLSDGRQITETYGGGAPMDGPAAAQIEQLSPTGPARMIKNNFPQNGATGCGCASGDMAPVGLAFAGLAMLRRRRR